MYTCHRDSCGCSHSLHFEQDGVQGEEDHQERDLDYYGHSGVCDYHSSIQDVLGYGTAQQHFLAEHGICQLLSAYEHLADEQLLFDDTQELEEAALVDGCGRLRTFFRIILPVSYPIICASMLIMFLSAWSQFQIPLILASNIDTKPAAIVASEFMTKDTVLYGITAAAGMLIILPPAIAALVFRKLLVRGMTGGSIKG